MVREEVFLSQTIELATMVLRYFFLLYNSSCLTSIKENLLLILARTPFLLL